MTKTKHSASFLAHEINNLLTSISLSTEMLLHGLGKKLDKSQKSYLKSILSDSKKIQRLVKKLKGSF